MRPIIVTTLLLFLFCPRALGQDGISPAHEAAVNRGLDFLASQQNRDGSFGATQKPALTGLALLSFLSAGQTPDVGKHGTVVRSAIQFLLNVAQADGSFGRDDRPMYGQAIATLALAQAWGVESSEEDRRRTASVLSNSIRLILRAQDVKKSSDFSGGWRYAPDAADSDLSLTGWNVLALRAAQDVGIDVPHANSQKAVQFVLRCYDAKEKGFAYQPHKPANVNCTAIGLTCLHSFESRNANRHAEVRDAVHYLATHPVADKAEYFYYGLYVTTHAAYEVGDPAWPAVSKENFPRLLKLQQPDGGWPAAAEGPGRVYTTSLALMTLTIPYHLLPLYQR
jgi:prenyltransferase beta subunit